MNTEQFKRNVVVIGGILLIYLMLGVYFKNAIGEWFAAIYYFTGIAVGGYYLYLLIKKDIRKGPKVIEVRPEDVFKKE